MKDQTNTNIFFYDGDCGFCDSTVLFLLDRVSPERLSFCSLHSNFAKSFFIKMGIRTIDISSSYLYDGQSVYNDSDAILKSLRLSYTSVKFLGYFFSLVPRFIRDYFYRLFAKNRYNISSITRKGCRLLNNEEQKRFVVQ